MRYRVRTPDGELDYASMRDVEVAYIQGLVGPDDDVREEGKETWRKASTIPTLVQARRSAGESMPWSQKTGIGAAVILGVMALRLIMHDHWSKRGAGIVLALAMSSVLMWLTVSAVRRRVTRKD